MNTITFLSLIALASTGFALMYDFRVRGAAHNAARRLILALWGYYKTHDHARDGK